LFEAAELFEKRSPKADEQIRNIKGELIGAVDACIDAAGREFEVHWQKKLLKVSKLLLRHLILIGLTDNGRNYRRLVLVKHFWIYIIQLNLCR
jgi:hypothetical protein